MLEYIGTGVLFVAAVVGFGVAFVWLLSVVAVALEKTFGRPETPEERRLRSLRPDR